MVHVILPILGAILMLLVVLDVFLTVLYARIGTGFISHRLACWVWWAMRNGTKPMKRWRDLVLSFAGPVMLVLLVLVWVLVLACGEAMIVQPALGTALVANRGDTPRDFVTAMYVVGDAMTTAGVSDLTLKTGFFRMFFFFCSFVGIFIITLTVTYYLQIYSSLQRRNEFAVKVHLMSSGTGDAAELLAGLGAACRFDIGYAHLSEMAGEMVAFEESHHFYSVLLYFRFREPHYALSRLALVVLDLVTLIKTALDDEEFGWLKQSAGVTQLWRAAMQMLTQLALSFLPNGLPMSKDDPIDEATKDRWRQRYTIACKRLREANIKTLADETLGAEAYIALRARWQRYISAFASHMAHPMEVIDPVGTDPKTSADRPEFSAKLRSID